VNLVVTVVGAAAFLAFAARDRLLPKRRQIVTENPEDVGYVMGPDPLLRVMPEREWREMERNALESV
jgi:hypothetical protein